MKEKTKLHLVIGDGVAVIRRAGSSVATEARILGITHDADRKPEELWLDRLVHRKDEDEFEGWDAYGPFVTHLVAKSPEPAQVGRRG